MNKGLLTVFVLLISLSSFGQADAMRANFWHFGKFAGLDFTCSPPVSFSGSALNSFEGSASISDINGNLLMYTDGVTVWDRNNNVMPNGTGLKGSQSTVQTAVIVPCFGNPDKYYIFTAGTSIEDQGVNGVCFSEVDMTLNGGLGAVIAATKNTLLFQPNEEKLTAVANAANNGYWVVAQEKSLDVWHAYEVTASGVNTTPVLSTTGPMARVDNSLGAKLSPDGSLLATQNVCGSGMSSNANMCLYSFNNATGQINFLWNDCGAMGFKIEFSPDNSKLYTSGGSGLFQYDLTSGGGVTDGVAIIASKTQIGASVDVLQLANDCKIYTGKSGTTQIGVIDNPNVAGTGCNYIPNYMALSSGMVQQRYPNFVQSFFRGPCTNLDFDLTKTDAHCQSDGTITLNLYSGIPTVTYLWSNGATTQNLSNLSGGMYVVIVTDGRGCTKKDSIFLNQPASAAVTSAIIVNPSACGSSDGSIDLTIDLVGGSAQSLIAESFESNGEGTRYVTTNGQNTGTKFFKNDVDAGFSFTGGAPTGEDGTHYYGCRNPATSPSTLTINSTSITGYTNLNACFSLACVRIANGTDNIKLQYSINGGAWIQISAFYSVGPFFNTFLEDTNGDQIGDGTQLTSAFQDFCYAISGTGNTIQLRVVMTSTSTLSQFAFDNIRLEGVPPNTYSVLWNTGTQAGATTEDIAGLPAESDSITITTGSGCIVGANFVLVDPCSTLPITLSGLAAMCNGNDILLNWTTASEQNSYKFYVEKRRGDDSWSVIGSVFAAGNSNTPRNYSITDISGAGELSYYRLRLVDINGGGQVYNPISISCDDGTNNMIVFPNPTNGSFTVQISSTKQIDGAVIQLMDVAGKLISRKTVTIVEGITQVLFDSSSIASGMYVVKVYGDNKAFKPVKVVKN